MKKPDLSLFNIVFGSLLAISVIWMVILPLFGLFSISFVHRYPHSTDKLQTTGENLYHHPETNLYLVLIKRRAYLNPLEGPYCWLACTKNSNGGLEIIQFLYGKTAVEETQRKDALVLKEQRINTYPLKNTRFESGILHFWFLWALGLDYENVYMEESNAIQKSFPKITISVPIGSIKMPTVF